MKKLWKRLVMLAALIGCMATAAWAGNVEVDIVDHNGPQIVDEAGYYVTSVYHSEKFEYHFDKNGRVAWKKATEAGQPYITRYTYDENGNVLKITRTIERVSAGRTTEIDTYTYDSQGRVVTHETDTSMEYGQVKHEYTIDTFTYTGNQAVVETVQKSDSDTAFAKYVYTMDEMGRPVKESKYRGDDKGDLIFIAEIVYSYDENGNLEKAETYMDDLLSHEITYLYNKDGKCVRSEQRSTGMNSYTAFVYEYDEYGNVTKMPMLDVDDVSGNEKVFSSCDYTYEKLTPIQDDSAYNDVIDKNEYYYDAVNWATLAGVTQGTSDTTFSPNQSCTRAQLVTFLWRAAGSPEPETSENPFTDVAAGSYYEKAVLWAVENNITNGVDVGRFAPNRTCTRAQIVTFIYRAAGEPDIEVQSESFTDVAADAYYAKAVAWAVANDITNGVDVGLFAPDRTCTRGQGVTFLYRGIGLY